MTKLSLVAIFCLGFAPAAFAADAFTPPSSLDYGIDDGSTYGSAWQGGYDAMAQVQGGHVRTSPVRPFTAEEKALFERNADNY